MNIDAICKEVQRIKRKYGETDPVKLCAEMKISLIYQPMGKFEGACKGFYLKQSRKEVIVINSDLQPEPKRITTFHEIGHHVNHKNLPGIQSFHDFSLFDRTCRYEFEANIFAAEYMMEDEDVLGLLNDDISFFDAARILGVPPELLDFKFRLLKRRGYLIIDSPITSTGDFLKRY